MLPQQKMAIQGPFFETLTIPLEWGITNLVLIPKVAYLELINQFCPISLLNMLYKLVSRIILQRLKPYIAEVINPCQVGFYVGASDEQ